MPAAFPTGPYRLKDYNDSDYTQSGESIYPFTAEISNVGGFVYTHKVVLPEAPDQIKYDGQFQIEANDIGICLTAAAFNSITTSLGDNNSALLADGTVYDVDEWHNDTATSFWSFPRLGGTLYWNNILGANKIKFVYGIAAPNPQPIEINMNVLVSAAGDIEMFGQAAPTVANVIVADVKLPVSALYSATGASFIEFWEPADARGTFKAERSSVTGDWTLLSHKLENGLQRCLEGKFDVSEASPFKTNYTNPLYLEVENFGELAIHTYAHYALGHINSSVAITNEAAFVKNMLSQKTAGAYAYADESIGNDFAASVTGTNADAKLAQLLVKAIADKAPSDILAIANQVLGQDVARARGKDNSERIVDERQKLMFMANDIIYMNIKLQKPDIIFSSTGQKVADSALEDLYASEENYTLKITLTA